MNSIPKLNRLRAYPEVQLDVRFFYKTNTTAFLASR
jgi:hypothetical protein